MNTIQKELLIIIPTIIFCFIGKLFVNYNIMIIYLLVRIWYETIIRKWQRVIIKEKRYIKKCDCGTEIIYTRRDCYHNTTWDIYSLYCPSCSHEYSYRRGTHHDLFDKEYEEDSVDKDEEVERLNNIIKKLEEFIERVIELYTIELTEENERKLSIVAPIKWVYKEIYNVLQELKGSDKEW